MAQKLLTTLSRNQPVIFLIVRNLYVSQRHNYLINVNNESDPEEQRKLSYFVIRTLAGRVIGLLPITFKTGNMLLTKRMFDQILSFETVDEKPQEYNDLYHELEVLDFSVSKYAKTIISNIIAKSELLVECMTIVNKVKPPAVWRTWKYFISKAR